MKTRDYWIEIDQSIARKEKKVGFLPSCQQQMTTLKVMELYILNIVGGS